MTDTDTRRNLLLLDEEFSYPLNSGKRLRTYNLMRALAVYFNITYLAYGDPSSVEFQKMKALGLNPIAVPPPDRRQHGWKFYWRLFANLFSKYPYIVSSHYTRRFQRRVYQALEEKHFDVVICEWTPYACFVRNITSVRKYINSHNIEADIWKRYEQQEKNIPRRLFIALQRAKVEWFETRCYHWVDGATAVSEEDAACIRNLGVPYPVGMVENGVDVDFFDGATDGDPNNIVFSGSMDWRPNQDAVTWFSSEILPAIQERCSGATFTIVGRKPSKRIQALESLRGVTVTGTVDDVRPYIRRAGVMVVPLRIGGGSRLKILEGMAMRKPVVSTTVGAEGLRVADGANILLADEVDSFASAVVRCLNDAALRSRLGQCGRDLVEQEYRWEILAERMHDYLCLTLKKR